jgi:hypothetical protein
VTPLQLQKRTGKVRCGRCMNVFDGFEGLTVAHADAAAALARPSTEPQTDMPRAASDVRSAPSAAPAALARMENAVRAAATSTTPDTREPDDTEADASAESRRRTWGIASIAMLVLLFSQLLFVYRSELGARFPLMRAALVEVCDVFGCAVPLPQRPDLLKIEASDVHMLYSDRPGLVQLTATLRSYATYDLAYPALDLVLTNANEHALARRIFVPDEYLDPTRDPQRGLSPNAEITVALDLDATDLNAAGFRLDLRAAPPP